MQAQDLCVKIGIRWQTVMLHKRQAYSKSERQRNPNLNLNLNMNLSLNASTQSQKNEMPSASLVSTCVSIKTQTFQGDHAFADKCEDGEVKQF